MSYPIPHFRDPDDLTTEMRATMAEAALKNLRRYAGRPDTPVLEDAVRPIPITLPPMRDIAQTPYPMPSFEPVMMGAPNTCGGLPEGFVITAGGLRRKT